MSLRVGEISLSEVLKKQPSRQRAGTTLPRGGDAEAKRRQWGDLKKRVAKRRQKRDLKKLVAKRKQKRNLNKLNHTYFASNSNDTELMQ
jgi:hypothetical protein